MTDKLEVTQADTDLAEIIMCRVKTTIENTLGQPAEVSHKGLAELLARHRAEHTTQSQDEGLADEQRVTIQTAIWQVLGHYEFHPNSDVVRAIRAAVEPLFLLALRSPDTSTDKCDECGRPYSTIYNIPNDIWAQIAPKPESLGEHIEHQAGGMLCTDCTTNRAREIGIELRFVGTVDWPDMAATQRLGQECEALTFERMLLDLIAVIQRDGGHRTGEIGIEQSWMEAMMLVPEYIEKADALRSQPDMAEVREALADLWGYALALEKIIRDGQYRSQELNDPDAWKNCDEWAYDGTGASIRDQVQAALAKLEGKAK